MLEAHWKSLRREHRRELIEERKKTMTQEQLAAILEKHKLWLNDEEGGERADLSGAYLSCANLSGADLSGAYLSCANLSCADLSRANLSGAYLSCANLSCADLSGAYLSCANLSGADLSGANLSYANLSGADLSCANLSGAKNLKSVVDFMEAHFERCADGYIVYKTFGHMYPTPESWKLEPGSVLTENVNFDRSQDCGCGINVAPLKWVMSNAKGAMLPVYKLLIRWEWLCGVCAPYMSDGKIRCERAEIIGVVE